MLSKGGTLLSAIHDLISQIADPRLRERLAAEWKAASQGRKFGLVFEDHLPELLPLPKAKPRRGDLICRRQGALKEVWQVKRVRDGVVSCVKPRDETHPSEPNQQATAETVDFALDEVLVVREFGEPIFPSLVPMDTVANGPADAPWHTLIEADNYHALQLLDYLYAGQVDCIYIDPPYNTGARDWKYNNDYVDGNDAWRHSKWLSMMQRRLRLAKRLLNPADSVLIVTIDEKEYLRLGLLLEQEFPEARTRMISTVINPKGVGVSEGFKRVDEYVFIVRLGDQDVKPTPRNTLGSRPVDEVKVTEKDEADDDAPKRIGLDWQTARRRDLSSVRRTRPGQFYPIYVNVSTGLIETVGDAIPHEQDRTTVKQREGCVAVFPVRDDGTEMNWGVTAPTFVERWKKGYARAGNVQPGKPQPYIIQYLKSGPIADIEHGRAIVEGYAADGSVIAYYEEVGAKAPPTQWNLRSHNAEHYGTKILRALLPSRIFPFPKSLYAVEDALRLFVSHKPEAIILDFFAGSGTTAHAVLRLNRQDGGRRRCISVTNNEVAADEQAALAAQGLQPGDADWEQWGICRHITFPRIAAAITGKTSDGEPIKGDYKFNDEFPIAEGFPANLAYFKLDFLDKERVTLKRAFREILPLLWLKAGAVGPRPELAKGEPEPAFFAPVGANFVVLLEESRMAALMKVLSERLPSPSPLAPLPGGEGNHLLSHVFIVTDSDESFKAMAAEVREAAGAAHPGLRVVQLYRDYLVNFMINQGGAK